MRPHPPWRRRGRPRVTRWAAATLVLAAALGCGEPAAPAEVRVYEIRGVVRALPASPGGELTVRHEAVPDFVDLAGRQVGMPAMTMGFALAPGVDLGEIEAGEKIELRLEVDWDRSAPAQVIEIAPLPAGTQLSFD